MRIPMLLRKINSKLAMLIPIFVLVLGFFVFRGVLAANYWVTDPTSCPSTNQTYYPGQNCDSLDICGTLSSNVAQCYNTSGISAPASTATSTTIYSGSLPGGYILDCFATDSSANGGYCSNNNNWWCNASSTCTSVNRITDCIGNQMGLATCGSCVSGFEYCDGSYTDADGCEIEVGVTATGTAAHYATGCTATCDTGYFDCNSEGPALTDGCEIHDTATCVSSNGLIGEYDGCSGINGFCRVDSSYFETGVNVRFATSSPLLWGTQYGSGNLMELSASNTPGGIFTITNDGRVGIGTSTLGSNNMLTVGLDAGSQFIVNKSGIITDGTWQAGLIGLAYGGTGLNLASSTGFLYLNNGTSTATSTIHIGNTDLAVANTGGSTLLSYAGNTITLNTAGNWAGTIEGIDISSASSTWDTTTNTVNANSSNWTSAYTSVNASSSSWTMAYNAITASSTDWQTAYTSRITSVGTGLSLSNYTISADTGYIIPLSASTTNWNTVYNTVNASSSNWTTAFGWGNHASANYIADADFSADGLMVRTASGAYTSRSVTGTANQIVVNNGNGVSDNPTLSLANYVYLGASGMIGRDADNLIDFSTDNQIIWRTNATNVMVLNSSGYLGIGTTTPSNALTVLSTNGAQLRLAYNASNYAEFTVDNTGQLSISSNEFQTTMLGGGDESFRIDTDGNIVIGTTTASAKLTLWGTAGIDLLNIASSTGSSLFVVKQDGSVGIGDVNPPQKLAVEGGVQFTSGNAFSLFTYPDDSAVIRMGDSTGAQKVYISSYSSSYFNGGNVGIGTTTPSQMLTIGDNNQFTVSDTGFATSTGIYNNGALTVTGQTTLANASSTNLTVTTDSYLGTVKSGTWNGTAIGMAYGGLGGDFSTIAKGGILTGTAAGTMGILMIGTDGKILMASSTATNGVDWIATSSLGISGSSQWTTSGSDIYYTTGNVSIGTSTSQEQLTVAGLMYIGGTGTSTIASNLHVMGALKVGNSSTYINTNSINFSTSATISSDSDIDITPGATGAVNISNANIVLAGTSTMPATPTEGQFFYNNKTKKVSVYTGTNWREIEDGEDISFESERNDKTTGSSPYSVAIGDLNNDGYADLAVANRANATISTFLNNGNGTFANKVDKTTGTSPYSVAIGDLNNDGYADLAVANYGSATISTFLNNGNGTFANKVDKTTGTSPYSVAIGDLNNDGYVDLAVANNTSNTVSTFLNSTSTPGTFADKVDKTTGSGPRSVSIDDFDNDGYSDLAVANYDSNTVSTFLNSTTTPGVFADKVDKTTGSGSISVAIGDLNNDGYADLAVANYGSATVSTFLNNGNGTFADKVDKTTGTNPVSVAIGDLNNDGYADLAVANYDSDTVSTFFNNGNGTFANKVDKTTGTAPYSVAIGDINNDGYADLAVANYDSDTVSTFLNNGNGTFNNNTDKVTGASPRFVAIGDINNDGYTDVVTANTSNNTISTFLNNGNGTFADKVDKSTGSMPFSVDIVDFDNDGYVDLAVANFNSATVSTYLNNGDGTFANKVDKTTGTNPVSVAIGDLNNDGYADLAVANSNSTTVSTFLNNGNGTFANKVDKTTGASPYSVAIGDLNNDGYADLVVANLSSNTVSTFLNNGNGTFADKVDKTTGSSPFSVAIGDLNNDGYADLAVANNSSDTVSTFLNNGNGTFADKVDKSANLYPHTVAIGDLNNDGYADLAVANDVSNTVSIFINNGNGVFANKVDIIAGSNPYSVAIGDLDNDGYNDLVVANEYSSTVSIFKNGTYKNKIQGDLMITGITRLQEKLTVTAMATPASNDAVMLIQGNRPGLNAFAGSANGTYFGLNADGNFTGNLIDLQVSSSSKFVIDYAGNVGIGTTTPAAQLNIYTALSASTTPSLLIQSAATASTTDGLFQIKTNVGSANNVVFKIREDGEAVSDKSFNSGGADYAEYFLTNDSDLQAGETVCIDIERSNSVKRCVRGADPDIMGIVSTKPAIIGNYADEKVGQDGNVIVGMMGQVPAYVTNDNGAIRPGDSLTSSMLTPGFLMRANPGDSTVGVALESFDAIAGKVNVLISRRNKSLTVETVEAKVTERIAAMEIEDDVRLMINDSLKSLDATEQIKTVISNELNIFDSRLTLKMDELSGQIISLENKYIDLDTRLAHLENNFSLINSYFDQASTTDAQIKAQLDLLNEKTIASVEIFDPFQNASTTVAIADIISEQKIEILNLQNEVTENKTAISTVESRVLSIEERMALLENTNNSNNQDTNEVDDSIFEIITAKLNLFGIFISDKVIGVKNLIADLIDTREIKITQTENAIDNIIGEGMIPAGATSAVIVSNKIATSSKLFITFRGDYGSRWWISDLQAGSSTIVIAEPLAYDIYFDWWVIGVNPITPSLETANEEIVPPLDIEEFNNDAILEVMSLDDSEKISTETDTPTSTEMILNEDDTMTVIDELNDISVLSATTTPE